MSMKRPAIQPARSRRDNAKGDVISQATPCTTTERLQRIEALGERIAGYIRYMAELEKLGNTSSEAKDRVIAAFYERLVLVERQLAKVQEEFQLE